MLEAAWKHVLSKADEHTCYIQDRPVAVCASAEEDSQQVQFQHAVCACIAHQANNILVVEACEGSRDIVRGVFEEEEVYTHMSRHSGG